MKILPLIRKVLKIILIICLVCFLFFLFYKPPLPNQELILDKVKNTEPIQEETDLELFDFPYEEFKYEISPLYTYELYGLVVSQYDSSSFFDFVHKNDPGNTKDTCVVWGENIKNNSYQKVKYKSGEFTCFYEWDKEPIPPFLDNSGSNNHLIPENENTAKIMDSINVGDQIHIKGYLVDYNVLNENGQIVSGRGTSITREDEGNGACETIFVTDTEILKKADQWPIQLRTIALWGMIISFLILFILVYLP